MGWYKNNVRHGNWMAINGHDMKIIESGWFEDGVRIGDMKDDHIYKNFTREDIFNEFSKLDEMESIINSRLPEFIFDENDEEFLFNDL